MLVVIDPHIGPAAHELAADLADTYGRRATCLVAPSEQPDDGLLAALQAAPAVVIESGEPPHWLTGLEAPKVGYDGDAAQLIEELTRRTDLKRSTGTGHKPKLRPLPADALKSALDSLGHRWRIEIVGARLLPHRLKAELVAELPCQSHLAAAKLARAIADIAEAQDHHPTLVHAYRTLTVRVTTGEAAGRLTERDLRFAHAINDLAGASLAQ